MSENPILPPCVIALGETLRPIYDRRVGDVRSVGIRSRRTHPPPSRKEAV